MLLNSLGLCNKIHGTASFSNSVLYMAIQGSIEMSLLQLAGTEEQIVDIG